MVDYIRGYLGTPGTQYESDIGTAFDHVYKIAVPEDLTIANMGAVVVASGAVVEPNPVPCLNDTKWSPRILEFIRKSGNKIRIPVSRPNNIIDVAANVSNTLNGFNSGVNPVICIKLFGERVKNAIEFFNLRPNQVAFAPIAPIVPIQGSQKSATFYKGIALDYDADGANPYGSNIPVQFKIQTDRLNQLPTGFDIVADCLGTVQLNVACAGNRYRKARHYRLTTGTTDVNIGNQTMKVPVADGAALGVFECGEKLAAMAHVICMRYQGEDFGKIHQLI